MIRKRIARRHFLMGIPRRRRSQRLAQPRPPRPLAVAGLVPFPVHPFRTPLQ